MTAVMTALEAMGSIYRAAGNTSAYICSCTRCNCTGKVNSRGSRCRKCKKQRCEQPGNEQHQGNGDHRAGGEDDDETPPGSPGEARDTKTRGTAQQRMTPARQWQAKELARMARLTMEKMEQKSKRQAAEELRRSLEIAE